MIMTTAVCMTGEMGLGVLAGVAVSKMGPTIDAFKNLLPLKQQARL